MAVLAKKEADTDLTKTTKVKILNYMNTKNDDPAIQELLDTTSLKDPRLKISCISSEIVQDIKTRVMSEVKETATAMTQCPVGKGACSDNTEAQSMDHLSDKKAK